jgi:putative lipoic acid-binding regulatory protein
MILDNSTQEKPTIEYPTRWGFKLIGRDKDSLLACIKEVMGEKEHLCSVGNVSRKRKFHSYNASRMVESQEERDRLFQCFQQHEDVEMVI